VTSIIVIINNFFLKLKL